MTNLVRFLSHLNVHVYYYTITSLNALGYHEDGDFFYFLLMDFILLPGVLFAFLAISWFVVAVLGERCFLCFACLFVVVVVVGGDSLFLCYWFLYCLFCLFWGWVLYFSLCEFLLYFFVTFIELI